MPTLDVYDLKNKVVGSIDLDDDIFSVEIQDHLFHEAVRYQMAKRHKGTHKVKNRGEVAYSTKKLFRQKGTGNARRGSRRSPGLRGSGVVFGPHPRDYSIKMNRKTRKAAMCSVLSLKVKEGKLRIVDSFELEQIKTKQVLDILGGFEMDFDTLIVDAPENKNLKFSVRNIPDIDLLPTGGINVYDILRHDNLILTKQAISDVEGGLRS